MSRLTILGGGNTGFSLAARLSTQGHDVLIWEHPDFASTLDPLADALQIELVEEQSSWQAPLAGITTDPAEALRWSDTLLCSVPSYAHQPFLDELGGHLHSGHLLVLLPGNLGSLVFADALKRRGISGVTIAESDTAPYVCRKTAPAQATIWGTVSGLGVGVFPSSQTGEVMSVLEPLFAGARPYDNVLEAGLSALNPVVHPAGVLLNAGRVERSRGDFYFYEEGVTPTVARTIEAVDSERLAIGASLGYQLVPVPEAFHEAGFGPSGDLWSVINGSAMLTALKAPGKIDTRWLSEDVPYGIATWAALGDQAGVETPVMDALVTLASAASGSNWSISFRSLGNLGIDAMKHEELALWLKEGGTVTGT